MGGALSGAVVLVVAVVGAVLVGICLGVLAVTCHARKIKGARLEDEPDGADDATKHAQGAVDPWGDQILATGKARGKRHDDDGSGGGSGGGGFEAAELDLEPQGLSFAEAQLALTRAGANSLDHILPPGPLGTPPGAALDNNSRVVAPKPPPGLKVRKSFLNLLGSPKPMSPTDGPAGLSL